jgi:predicted GTPase
MTKLVTIIGQEGVGKTTFFHQITKKYSVDITKKSSPLINYAEELIGIESNIYKIIDTPKFILSPKNEIEKEMSKQLGEILKKSDLVL